MSKFENNENSNFTDLTEEVTEIITKVPSWFVRWGISVILITFSILITISCFIKYPDTVNAKITITTHPSPVNIFSKSSGNLILFKRENDKLNAGDIIGYIQRGPNLDQVLNLEKLCNLINRGDYSSFDRSDSLLRHTSTGLDQLQPYFNQLSKARQQLVLFDKTQSEKEQIKNLESQKNTYLLINENLREQVKFYQQEFSLVQEKYRMDSTLYTQNVISKVDYNTSKSNYLEKFRSLKNTNALLYSNMLSCNEIDSRIAEIEASFTMRKNDLLIEQGNSIQQLLAEITKWKEANVFIAPSSGKLAVLEPLEDHQFVENGKLLFSIIPASKALIGKVTLPVKGSGKVAIGQRVNVRLANFPFENYGMLQGVIESYSLLPNENGYLLKVSFPKGMETTYKMQIPFREQLEGDTEIITENISLMQRFFYQFFKALYAPR